MVLLLDLARGHEALCSVLGPFFSAPYPPPREYVVQLQENPFLCASLIERRSLKLFAKVELVDGLEMMVLELGNFNPIKLIDCAIFTRLGF